MTDNTQETAESFAGVTHLFDTVVQHFTVDTLILVEHVIDISSANDNLSVHSDTAHSAHLTSAAS